MKKLFVLLAYMLLIGACDPSARHIFYPRTEKQYLVSCIQGHSCFRKADLICGNYYQLHVLRPFDPKPHLLIECH